MKKILIILSILIYDYAISAQNLDSISVRISNAYNKAYNCDSLKYQQDFFNVFPDNFQLFNALYGWNHDEEKPQMMYDLYVQHITLFCNLQKIISTEDYYHKVIKLVLNGHWDADAVSMLQRCVQDFVSSNTQSFINILSQYSEEDVIKFWFFFYDTLYFDHPLVLKFYADVSAKIEKINYQMFQLMEKVWIEMTSSQ